MSELVWQTQQVWSAAAAAHLCSRAPHSCGCLQRFPLPAAPVHACRVFLAQWGPELSPPIRGRSKLNSGRITKIGELAEIHAPVPPVFPQLYRFRRLWNAIASCAMELMEFDGSAILMRCEVRSDGSLPAGDKHRSLSGVSILAMQKKRTVVRQSVVAFTQPQPTGTPTTFFTAAIQLFLCSSLRGGTKQV
jgi:hypothetical protein